MFALLQESWNSVEKACFFSDHLPRISMDKGSLTSPLFSLSAALISPSGNLS